MEFKDLLSTRVSIRKFTNKSIPNETVNEIIRRASLSPSVANSQPWKFIAIRNSDYLSKMSEVVIHKYDDLLEHSSEEMKEMILTRIKNFSTFFLDSPVVIACICGSYRSSIDDLLENTMYDHDDINTFRNHPDIQTMGAAIYSILLSAVDLGYGGCWLTGPMVARSEIEEILGITHPDRLIAFVALGEPAFIPPSKTHKPLKEILRFID